MVQVLAILWICWNPAAGTPVLPVGSEVVQVEPEWNEWEELGPPCGIPCEFVPYGDRCSCAPNPYPTPDLLDDLLSD